MLPCTIYSKLAGNSPGCSWACELPWAAAIVTWLTAGAFRDHWYRLKPHPRVASSGSLPCLCPLAWHSSSHTISVTVPSLGVCQKHQNSWPPNNSYCPHSQRLNTENRNRVDNKKKKKICLTYYIFIFTPEALFLKERRLLQNMHCNATELNEFTAERSQTTCGL